MNVTISYQTLQLPPPFAFAYTLELHFLKDGRLEVGFQLEYLNRDTVSESEILEEGFTPDDDYQWKGVLPITWSDYLKPLLVNASFTETSDHDPLWVHFKFPNKEGNVANPEDWDFILQELIQAIYEISEKELPLKIKFIFRDKGKSEFYELLGSFAERKSSINKGPVSWQSMQLLLSEIFSFEFTGEVYPQPKHDGWWVDPDGQSGFYSIEALAGSKANLMINNLKKVLK